MTNWRGSKPSYTRWNHCIPRQATSHDRRLGVFGDCFQLLAEMLELACEGFDLLGSVTDLDGPLRWHTPRSGRTDLGEDLDPSTLNPAGLNL